MILASIILLIVFSALAVYAIFGGADFGVGIWEALTFSRSSESEKNLSYNAIGPVWETNHVWLIFILVLLFGAFPAAFAAINEALFVPMLLALLGIVFRGAAYAFRSQLKSYPSHRRIWESVFAAASIFAPLFLGATVGAIASGELKFDSTGKFIGNHLTNWINPLSVYIGIFTVGMCAYTSAVLLFREARILSDAKLEVVWKQRSLLTGTIMGVAAMGGLLLVATGYSQLWHGMLARGWPLIGVSLVTGIASLILIARGRVHLAAFSISLTCASVVFGWALAQYPYLLPDAWSIETSRSPDSVLQTILNVTLIGAIFLAPSLYFLFAVFKMENQQTQK